MLELFIENMKELLTNPGVVLFGAITIIQISPIKIDPWTWVGKTIRKFLVGNIQEDVGELKKEVTEMKVQNWRWNVLDFANSCKNGRRHTLDEWKHTISQLAEYERYIERNDITNGVFAEDASYLRSEYREHCEKNDFL